MRTLFLLLLLLLAQGALSANDFSIGAYGSHVNEYNFSPSTGFKEKLKIDDRFNGGLIFRLPISISWRLSFLAAGGSASNASISLVYQTSPMKKAGSRSSSFGEAVTSVLLYGFALLRTRWLFGLTATGLLREQNEPGWGLGLTYGLRTAEYEKFYLFFRHSFLFLNDAFLQNRGEDFFVDYSIIAQIELGVARRF